MRRIFFSVNGLILSAYIFVFLSNLFKLFTFIKILLVGGLLGKYTKNVPSQSRIWNTPILCVTIRPKKYTSGWDLKYYMDQRFLKSKPLKSQFYRDFPSEKAIQSGKNHPHITWKSLPQEVMKFKLPSYISETRNDAMSRAKARAAKPKYQSYNLPGNPSGFHVVSQGNVVAPDVELPLPEAQDAA